jgi:SAM-dependent methyltransferase
MPGREIPSGKEGIVMPKLGEINYLKSAGADGIEHVRNKPFSDDACGRYLGDLGLVMGLLPPPPARILDLGVGSGWTTIYLSRRGYEVTGRDICPDMIALAELNRDLLAIDSASFEVGDYETMPYRNEFDSVLFYDSLHHAEDERAALKTAYDALRPGGICLTVEPGEGHAAASTEAVKTFGVTEKDMPPHRIIAIGQSVGFREFQVYSRSRGPVLLTIAGSEGLPQLSPKLSRLQCAVGFALKSLRTLLMGTREGDSEFLSGSLESLALRAGNIVRMRK